MSNIVIIITSGANQIATVGTAFGSPIQALVETADGQALSGRSVSFSIQNTGNVTATFPNNQSQVTIVTDTNGSATSPIITAGQSQGNINVTVTCGSVSTPVTLAIVLAAQLTKAGGDAQLGYVVAPFSNSVSVNVLNPQGGPAADGTSVTFEMQPTGYATFTGGLNSVTALSKGGIATSPTINSGSVYGPFQIIATMTGVSDGLAQVPSPVTFSETILKVSQFISSGGNNQELNADAWSAPLVVQALDPQGNAIPDGAIVTFQIDQNGSSNGVFFEGNSSSATASTVEGLASSPSLTGNNLVSFQIVATLTGPPTGQATVTTTFNATIY